MPSSDSPKRPPRGESSALILVRTGRSPRFFYLCCLLLLAGAVWVSPVGVVIGVVLGSL